LTIRVLVADDQALVRGAFTVLVNSASDLSVVGEASNGAEAVRLAGKEHPDVVLMDIRMPEMDGIEATRAILATDCDSPHVLILTTFDLDEYVYEALRAGASGFLLKDTPPEQLLSAIRVIAEGNALLAPSITRTLIAEFASRHRPDAPTRASVLDQITPREGEVLTLVARGRSNIEIADELHMSHATAKTHVSRLLAKLGARDRAQLVVIAYESGLMTTA
jgi:DNA-binding NarL/FixJ family response regulator